jgi:hypothetical protein
VNIEDAAEQFVCGPSRSCGLYGNADLINERIETFLEPAVTGHDYFFIEVVAINVNGGTLVDLARHENNAVLQPHG